MGFSFRRRSSAKPSAEQLQRGSSAAASEVSVVEIRAQALRELEEHHLAQVSLHRIIQRDAHAITDAEPAAEVLVAQEL